MLTTTVPGSVLVKYKKKNTSPNIDRILLFYWQNIYSSLCHYSGRRWPDIFPMLTARLDIGFTSTPKTLIGSMLVRYLFHAYSAVRYRIDIYAISFAQTTQYREHHFSCLFMTPHSTSGRIVISLVVIRRNTTFHHFTHV